jgi:rfaE bifunctional protein nucleotidyltransferase chain/domain
MYMRLGFSVATHVNPDVLLVDEVLAVGDEGFTHKCLDKFADFKRRGKTVLLVTHSLGLVERFCDDAIWLDGGRKRAQGDPKRIVDLYVSDVARQEEQVIAASDERMQQASGALIANRSPLSMATDPAIVSLAKPASIEEGRWGSGLVRIIEVALFDGEGKPAHMFESGDPVRIGMRVEATQDTSDFVFGIGIFNTEGVCVYGTNTDIEEYEPVALSGIVNVDVIAVRLPPSAVHVSREVADEGRRHLPAETCLGVFARRHDEAEGLSVLGLEEAAAFVAEKKARGLRVVFTNGVFDLLHPGHVRYLQTARSLGDVLIVGVNSDRSVRENKGPSRPIIPERERAEVLEALSVVDAAVIFDDPTPQAIIDRLRPDVLVKGADWAADNIVGRDTVEARGGRVVRMELSKGYSTTELIRKVRATS